LHLLFLVPVFEKFLQLHRQIWLVSLAEQMVLHFLMLLLLKWIQFLRPLMGAHIRVMAILVAVKTHHTVVDARYLVYF
jgi:hypothetical protein